ncbi:MAG: SRPBCC domain-containing protein [Gammaproteobacteria bacterium]
MADRVRGYAHRVDIDGEVPTVWRAFTEPAHLTRWCAPDAQLRPRAGGLFRATVDRVTELEAHIDVYDPNRRLRLIYLPSAALPATDTVIVADFILEPALPPAEGVILRVLGSGIPEGPAWDTRFKRMKVGWAAAMSRLKVYVETQMV